MQHDTNPYAAPMLQTQPTDTSWSFLPLAAAIFSIMFGSLMVGVGLFAPIAVLISPHADKTNIIKVMASLIMLAIAGVTCVLSGLSFLRENYRLAWLLLSVSCLLILPILIIVFSA